MIYKKLRLFLCFIGCMVLVQGAAEDFTLVNKSRVVMIIYDLQSHGIDSIAAHLLADDIERITTNRPVVTTSFLNAKGNVIVIGNIESNLVRQLLPKQSKLDKQLRGKWECYGLVVTNHPSINIDKALIIAGSDKRGTAYGVFHLSELIGVSPWYWWADVHPKQQKKLSITIDEYVSITPSVKYRGIFLNDEDWGLQPWSAKTFEPETGDIGPKTYARIFELLLRLKANMIWPAMHPSTKAFYTYPGNKKVAAEYSIIIGSSHAEPMLRNNVGEWDEKTMGHFNYITNTKKVQDYWEDRVRESSSNEAIYTMGMRGVHDSGIEGVKTPKEAVPLLETIFKDQREMLQKHVNKNITSVPQVFTAYKEVLDIYDNNLKLPGDITIVWPDDNYGYIQRLSNAEEQSRAGGSGVYYHASYWGRPHDYLWLSSTHPALIREEMMKAFDANAKSLWVLNVGDLKPLEYNIQLFLDMAYNAKPFKNSSYVKQHLIEWSGKIFGNNFGKSVAGVMLDYYQLAFERRPEFMGWSQTEPTTATNYTAYNHFYYGDEAQKRIDKYNALQSKVNSMRTSVGKLQQEAFYELVYYPVTVSSLMNKKFLYRDKSYLYAKQNRLSAFDYAVSSKQVYDSIQLLTNYYNDSIVNGKWKYIMSMKPRDLPVYKEPVIPAFNLNRMGGWGLLPEGYASDSSVSLALPPFEKSADQKYFIDIFLKDDKAISWKATAPGWITLSQSSGLLKPVKGLNQCRLWVNINWLKAPAAKHLSAISFLVNDKITTVAVKTDKSSIQRKKNTSPFVEGSRLVSMYASSFNRKKETSKAMWAEESIGYSQKSMKSILSSAGQIPDTLVERIKGTASRLEYDFITIHDGEPKINMYTLPTSPLNKNYRMRYAVSVDDSPLTVVDFRTFGRSEEWKQNVLRNNAVKSIAMPFMRRGLHTLKIYLIDPGVVLDRIVIDMGGYKPAYSILPESKKSK